MDVDEFLEQNQGPSDDDEEEEDTEQDTEMVYI